MKLKLRHSDPIQDFETVKAKILANLNAEILDIDLKYELRSLPSEIAKLKNLTKLRLTCCYDLEELPEEIVELINLQSFQHIGAEQSNLPQQLGLLKNLKKLTLSGQKYNKKTDWSELLKLEKLESLELSESLKACKGELPAAIFELKKLIFLYLENNLLKKLPPDISNLTSLLVLDLGHNAFTQFPEVLLQLPKLENLVINANVIDTMPEALFDMPTLKELTVTGKDNKRFPNVALFEKFFRHKKLYAFDHKYISFVLDIIKNPEQVNELDEAELTSLLDCGIDSIAYKALAYLEKYLQEKFEQNPLKKGSCIVLKGDSKELKNRLKERLKALEIQTAVKVTTNSRHLLLGINAAISWQEIQAVSNITILSEDMLFAALNVLEQPFLLQENNTLSSNDEIAKISALLSSGQEENFFLAFQLLHGGGFPKELLTDMVLLYKETDNPKIRKEALSFIQKVSSFDFVEELKRRLPLMKDASEATISANIVHYCTVGKLDPKKILTRVYAKLGKGISFALFHLNTADKKAFFAPLIKDGMLDLSRLPISTLPADLPTLGEFKKLNITFTAIAIIPDVVINEMPFLEEIWIYATPIESFPMALLGMENLKKVVIAGNLIRYLPPKKIVEATNLKIVEFVPLDNIFREVWLV